MLGHWQMVGLIHSVLIWFFRFWVTLVNLRCFVSWILEITLMLIVFLLNRRWRLRRALLILLWRLGFDLVSRANILIRIIAWRCHAAASHITTAMLEWWQLIRSINILKYTILSRYWSSAIHRCQNLLISLYRCLIALKYWLLIITKACIVFLSLIQINIVRVFISGKLLLLLAEYWCHIALRVEILKCCSLTA